MSGWECCQITLWINKVFINTLKCLVKKKTQHIYFVFIWILFNCLLHNYKSGDSSHYCTSEWMDYWLSYKHAIIIFMLIQILIRYLCGRWQAKVEQQLWRKQWQKNECICILCSFTQCVWTWGIYCAFVGRHFHTYVDLNMWDCVNYQWLHIRLPANDEHVKMCGYFILCLRSSRFYAVVPKI